MTRRYILGKPPYRRLNMVAVCRTCQKEFNPTKKTQVYCTKSCRMKVERLGYGSRQCAVCGETFNRKHPSHKICSDRCRLRHDEIRMKNPRCGRFVILRRDAFTCVYCGSSPEAGVALHVDHVIPRKHGGSDQAKNLITACDACNLCKGGVPLSPELQERFLALARLRNDQHHINQDVCIGL